MTHPAERITQTPDTNTATTPASGRPLPASHSAHSMGHNSSRAPIGRSQRINSAYCPSRARTVGA